MLFLGMSGPFVTNPGIRVGNSYEKGLHSYFSPDGRQKIKDSVFDGSEEFNLYEKGLHSCFGCQQGQVGEA